MLKKRVSRLYAIQILYQLHFVNNKDIDLAVDTFLKYYQDQSLSTANHDLVRLLVLSASGNEEETKSLVEPYLRNYKWKDLELIIALILRVAIVEMQNFPNLDIKVIISEYITIASTFFENNQISIINPILEQVAKDIRPSQEANKKE